MRPAQPAYWLPPTRLCKTADPSGFRQRSHNETQTAPRRPSGYLKHQEPIRSCCQVVSESSFLLSRSFLRPAQPAYWLPPTRLCKTENPSGFRRRSHNETQTAPRRPSGYLKCQDPIRSCCQVVSESSFLLCRSFLRPAQPAYWLPPTRLCKTENPSGFRRRSHNETQTAPRRPSGYLKCQDPIRSCCQVVSESSFLLSRSFLRPAQPAYWLPPTRLCKTANPSGFRQRSYNETQTAPRRPSGYLKCQEPIRSCCQVVSESSFLLSRSFLRPAQPAYWLPPTRLCKTANPSGFRQRSYNETQTAPRRPSGYLKCQEPIRSCCQVVSESSFLLCRSFLRPAQPAYWLPPTRLCKTAEPNGFFDGRTMRLCISKVVSPSFTVMEA